MRREIIAYPRDIDALWRYGREPWMVWLVTALAVQRARQRWHHAVTACVRADGDDVGELPGWPGWRYRRHGIGVCLEAPDGEVLDVDFNDDTGAVIDVWFFAWRVDSVRDSERWVAERQLWRWRPSREVIVDGIDELVAAGGAMYTSEYKHQIALAPEVEAIDPAQVGVAEVEGEGAWAEAWRAWLRERARVSRRGADYLDVIVPDAPADEVRALCEPYLWRARFDGAVGHVIGLLRGRRDVAMEDVVRRVVSEALVEEDHPYPVHEAFAYLFERGAAVDLEAFDRWAGLARAKGYNGNPKQSEFAALALRFAPERAMRLVRASLRSTTPICVQESAALLAAIDQRWCHRELAAALAEQPQRGTHAYLAAALKRTSSELAARRAAVGFVPPIHDDRSAGFTFDEVLAANADDFLAGEARRADGLAAELRARYPEDWTGD